MSRPIKNSCDYFPHDRDMRNHKKVKAIRSKFKAEGYAIWTMILEYLTGSDGNVFEYSDIEFELMAGDFGVSATEIRGVVDYCILLELLFHKNGFVNSESLDERLAPVYQKRNKSKELSKQQLRVSGKYVAETPKDTAVSVAETPQSKVKESKVKESKEFTPPSLLDFQAYFVENGFRSEVGARAWHGYDVADWHKSNGEKIKNWKQTCHQVWFKDENKDKKQIESVSSWPAGKEF